MKTCLAAVIALLLTVSAFAQRPSDPALMLPQQAPDSPITTLAIECDAEPTQDNIFVRREKPRAQVNVSKA